MLFEGKPRSRFGKWLDSRGVSQEFVSQKSGISRNTISRMSSEKDYSPNMKTLKKLRKALKEIDSNKEPTDFFM